MIKSEIMTESIKVEIKDIKVGKLWFSFSYKVWRNKKLIKEGNYSNSHERSHNTMRKYLKNGYATELVLEREF